MKKPRVTRREKILQIFSKGYMDRSCAQIVTEIINDEEIWASSTAHYLSGSISSILAKMVKDGILEYAPGKSIRGGHLYQLKTK